MNAPPRTTTTYGNGSSRPDGTYYAVWGRWSTKDQWCRQGSLPDGMDAAQALEWAAKYAALHPGFQVCCMPAAQTIPVRTAEWSAYASSYVLASTIRRILWADGPDTEHDADTLAALAELIPFEAQP